MGLAVRRILKVIGLLSGRDPLGLERSRTLNHLT